MDGFFIVTAEIILQSELHKPFQQFRFVELIDALVIQGVGAVFLRAFHRKTLLINATFDMLLNTLSMEDVTAEEEQLTLKIFKAKTALL